MILAEVMCPEVSGGSSESQGFTQKTHFSFSSFVCVCGGGCLEGVIFVFGESSQVGPRLCSPGWPLTGDLPASASQVLVFISTILSTFKNNLLG